jgi:hypothetical protein
MTSHGRPGAGDTVPVVREEDIRPVAGRGGSRFLVVALVLAGLGVATTVVKPWEVIVPAVPGAPVPGGWHDGGAATRPLSTPVASPAPDGSPALTTTSPACASPQSWRTATIESWFGRMARVWSAVEAGEHALEDPSLPFEPVVAERITAIGWCAPVLGPDRPPVAARASLWRAGDEGMELVVSYVRLEPEGPNALGELWAPPPGNEGVWPPGRYVIELRTPSGSWRHTIGIEILTARPDTTPAPSPSMSPSPAP